MLVSRDLHENLVKIKDLVKLERNLVIDLIDINGVEGLFISKSYIDSSIYKFMKQYFGNISGFEHTSFTQSLDPVKKLDLKKSVEIEDVNKFLNNNKAVLVIDGIPQIYGVGVDNYRQNYEIS